MTRLATETRPARPTYSVSELAGKVTRQGREVAAAREKFFTEEADRIVACCPGDGGCVR